MAALKIISLSSPGSPGSPKGRNKNYLRMLMDKEGFQESVDIEVVRRNRHLPWDRGRLSHNPGVSIQVMGELEDSGAYGRWTGCISRFIPLWKINEFYGMPFTITMYCEYLSYYPHERLHLSCEDLIERTNILTYFPNATFASMCIVSKVLSSLPMRVVQEFFTKASLSKKMVRRVASLARFNIFETAWEFVEFIAYLQSQEVYQHVISRIYVPVSTREYAHVPFDTMRSLCIPYPTMLYGVIDHPNIPEEIREKILHLYNLV